MPLPTEPTILSSLLLPPAPLPTIFPLAKFTALFPASARSHPQIPLLYRDLQHQRALDIDTVRKNIAAEAKRGEGQRREIARRRRREERDVGVELEGIQDGEGKWAGRVEELMQDTSKMGSLPGKAHTLSSILPEMEDACEDLEAEIAELEKEAEGILRAMQGTVGGLSDLRYGKFALPVGGGEVAEDVLEGLKGLREVCGRVGGGKEG